MFQWGWLKHQTFLLHRYSIALVCFQVLVLRELAVCTPTFFFQQVQQFFECIFNAVRDPKPTIREGAVAALRAALVVTSQRETKQKERPLYYRVGIIISSHQQWSSSVSSLLQG